MKIGFTDNGWTDYLYWQETDAAVAQRINGLIKEATRTPFSGIGKPEPLRGAYAGWWSRRITGEHRLIYRVSGRGVEQILEIAQCRYHYRR